METYGLSFLYAGAGKESRTPDLNLGKVALYQLSYSRENQPSIIAESTWLSKHSNAHWPLSRRAYSMTCAIASAT